ncbi:response regulator transcription factor [Paenibacillus radicis (ex Xue et al. 2023)]|uniref:Response regulator n=1 Tax=Paenibacillus radicis (ex Xue et al. 2023) TaxID=2972489 RepID=A0ABT1YEH1_9BACL|nr:response regulator [Paenibacillus radicis (ex Xue et al. 2023)]MCR8631592.1 response regulator [Paenibacillus radicis (ex Xue et al. 2023)]
MYKVLVVDDERIEREGIKFLISHYDFPIEITEAENGLKALQVLKAEKVDILFTDIRMPFMDGLQLIAEARAIQPDLKAIILSAYGEFDFAKEAIRLQVAHYLLKPVETEEFHEVFSNVLGIKGKPNAEMLLDALPDRSNGSNGSTSRKVIEEVLQLIHNHYRESIGLDWIAEQVYLTPSYLSYLFKKEMGVNIVKYIVSYRFEKAAALLCGTNMKIIDISVEVGYENYPYFCSQFKNYFGTTPAKYREGQRK